MKTTIYKLAEFFVLFILMPVSFSMGYPIFIKMAIGLIGFVYVIYVLLKVEKRKFQIFANLDWKHFWTFTLLKFVVIVTITLVYMWFVDKNNMFDVVVNKPKMWVIIMFVYSLLSVYPQELIYRTFIFKRYQTLFSNDKLFIFFNAIVFSLGHIFFKNTLVIVLTFLAGIFFAFTYNKTKSTVMVSIEHAIYGCWLFTVGMGSMLGFPS